MRATIVLLGMLLGSTLGLSQASALGDRLVVSINSATFTQRQVESYILVRESLRDNNDGKVPRVTAQNWEVALKFFAEEMSIHQEALRLGSLQVPSELLRKSVGKVRDRLNGSDPLVSLSRRLGIDNTTLNRTVHNILRVKTFRRSRNRQEAIARNKDEADSQPQWLVELYDRTIIRFYDGAWDYKQIQPTQGLQSGDAL